LSPLSFRRCFQRLKFLHYLAWSVFGLILYHSRGTVNSVFLAALCLLNMVDLLSTGGYVAFSRNFLLVTGTKAPPFYAVASLARHYYFGL
jgi:hypothetical protein